MTMRTVGALVQEALDLMGSGSPDMAMRPVSLAVQSTAGKALSRKPVQELDISTFVKANWGILSFGCAALTRPLPLNIPFALKRIVPTFNSLHGVQEIIALVVSQTLERGELPPHFKFNWDGEFAAKGGRLLLPSGLPSALLGTVIFHPVSAGEPIGERYWFSVGDFRMFVTELFGRQDLMDRIIEYHKDAAKRMS
ncbi:MAG TPA: hypothetical protein VGJ02_08835 [Pyrinomonadaceae bacterium]|jgi:hypothetical protein